MTGSGVSCGIRHIMTVNRPVPTRELDFALSHEHILVEFIGADQVSSIRYDQEKVFDTMLPYLRQAR